MEAAAILEQRATGLTAYLVELETQLADSREAPGEDIISLLAWAWQHRASHRGLSDNVLAVFRVDRNHRVFSRGKRVGHSPPELLGLPWPHWLDALGSGRPKVPTAADLPAAPVQTVNTLAA